MNTEKNEIFIQVKGIGFTFLLDKRMKHNLISPAFLAFFNLEERQMYSLPENNIGEVNTNPVYDNLQPFLPDYVDSISTNDVFHYVGKKVGRCKDNKLRVCKVFRLGFEHEGCTFSFPFILDKSLDVPAMLGREAFNRINKTLMSYKVET
ncbi:hypothetical protein [Leyella lascolaii]|uniref:Uncharacterized protein n=1 Tax=Leyella lascolaii TaxID=1776379 RepID=A0AAW7JLM2_9BACT|nr:hypothetical protein [Leyella lascolaii]MDN0022397.1 hypothetical protein [Leyella lascolaii]MDN0024996.1 hypothetical protein [Leyella lascolaii]